MIRVFRDGESKERAWRALRALRGRILVVGFKCITNTFLDMIYVNKLRLVKIQTSNLIN